MFIALRVYEGVFKYIVVTYPFSYDIENLQTNGSSEVLVARADLMIDI